MSTVYRIFNGDELLYVGCSMYGAQRLQQHAGDKPWWPEATHVTLEHHDSQDDALVAEAAAITSENPKHNRRRTGRLSADQLAQRRATREKHDREWRELQESTYFSYDVRCSNCGRHNHYLPKGVSLTDVPCVGCECKTLSADVPASTLLLRVTPEIVEPRDIPDYPNAA